MFATLNVYQMFKRLTNDTKAHPYNVKHLPASRLWPASLQLYEMCGWPNHVASELASKHEQVFTVC